MSSWLARVVVMTQEPRWLSDDEQRAWLSYRRMTRQLEARLAQELARDSGVSMQDYDVLSALTAAAGYRLCAKDLGTHLLWSPCRLTPPLHRMGPGKLVQGGACPEGRGSDAVLTSAGLAAIQGAAPGHV